MATVITIEIEDKHTEQGIRTYGAETLAHEISSLLGVGLRKLTVQSIDDKNARKMAAGQEYDAFVDQWIEPGLNESIGNMKIDKDSTHG